MRTTTIAAAVLGTVVTLLTSGTAGTPAGAATAGGPTAGGFDARARLGEHRTCTTRAGAGITRRTLVLDNSRSGRRAQFKVVREGDRYAAPKVYVWVPAHRKRSLVVSVPQRTTVSVRVRVPEMGRANLRLSRTVPALPSCYVRTLDPRASLGGVWCHDGDSVAQVVLDNRATSDDRVAYTVASSYGRSAASLTVRPASSTNYYLPVPSGRSTHVEVTAGGRQVLSTVVAAVDCSR